MKRYEPDAMIAEARRQRMEVEALAARPDEAAFGMPPARGGWSVGECIEHLTLINRIYLDAIDDAMQKGHASPLMASHGPPAKRHGWVGDAFVRSLAPPVKLRGKAFKRTIPERRARAEVLREFLETQDRIVSTIDGARDLDFSRVRMSSPFFRLLRLSLGQSFGAMLAHNRRHIMQAEGVFETADTGPRS